MTDEELFEKIAEQIERVQMGEPPEGPIYDIIELVTKFNEEKKSS